MEDEDAPLNIRSYEADVAPAGGGEDLPLVFRTPETKEPTPRTWGETATGYGKTIKSGLAQNVPALVGVPGSVEEFAVKDVPQFLKGVGAGIGEKADIISPKRAEEIRQAPLPWIREEGEKRYAPFTSLPTYKGVKETVKDLARQTGRPEFAYEPETRGEKVLGAAIEGGVQAVPGAARTIAGRVISGTTAGAASEFAGGMSEGQENEPFARLAGALGGGYAGSKFANALLPATVGRMEIADALADDLRKGLSPMTLEQAKEAAAAGHPITIVDIAGPATLKRLSTYANMSPDAQTRAGVFNKFIIDRSVDAGARVGEDVRGVMGVKTLDADALQRLNESAGATTRNTLYGALKNHPAADAVPTTGFSPKLLNDDNFTNAYNAAMNNAPKLPDTFKIKTPEIIPGKPAVDKVETKWEQTPQGFKEVPGSSGSAAIPEREIPGNMAFMQQVDMELGDMIKKAVRAGDKQLAAGMKGSQDRLRDELDKVMLAGGSNRNYRETVGQARKTFVAEEAPQAGYEFATSLINSRKNPFKRGDVRAEFDAMDDANKEFLRLGVAARIQDAAESGELGKLAKKFSGDKAFQADMQHVLGPEKYNQMMGSVLRENVIHNADTIGFIASKMHPGQAAGAGAGIMAGGDILKSMVYGPGAMEALGQASFGNKAILGALAGMGIQMGSSLAERRVADRVLPLVFSKDPKDAIKLGELATSYPMVEQFVNRLTVSMNTALQGMQRSLENQDKAKKANGGRIERRAGGRAVRDHHADAERLVVLAEKAKKEHSRQTEPLLQSDDSVVAKALEVSSRHI
jgi:hypothetical protein